MKTTDNYNSFIFSLLQKHKFLAGTELIENIISKFGVTTANARKIVQRASFNNIIDSSKPLTFGKGQFIYMLPGNSLELSDLRLICKKYRPPLYRILIALDNNNGIISYYEALKISATLEEKTSSKTDTVNELLHILIKLNLVRIETDNNSVRYIIDNKIQEYNAVIERHFSNMILDVMFLPDILKWLKKVNIIDNIKIIYRNKQNPSKGGLHNNLVWDAFAYTKTTGFNIFISKSANSIEKQTFVALDVVINRHYSQYDLDGFVGRIQIYLNSVKTGVRKILPIVVYRSITNQVQNKIQALGFICFDIGSIFGNRIYEIIEKLNLIQGRANLLEKTPLEDEISKTLIAIRESGQENNLSNLKGILFEYLLYPMLHIVYGGASILHGKTLSEKNDDGKKESYEYDFIILSQNPKELIVIEAKGYSSSSKIPVGDTTTKNTLSWFFGKTLPFLKKKYSKEISEGYRLKASYITSSSFYDDGIKYLNAQTKYRSKKLNNYYDGDSLIQLLKDNDFEDISKTVESYYIKS